MIIYRGNDIVGRDGLAAVEGCVAIASSLAKSSWRYGNIERFATSSLV
jgi:hypothetical protein